MPRLTSMKSDRPDAVERQFNAFSEELLKETAEALGRLGRDLEQALAALKRHDETPGSNLDRDALVQNAADKAFALFIQRDYLGLKSDHHLTATYDIPNEVMLRVGVIEKKKKVDDI
ncbi:DUF6665 family protein [Martelella sp. HB161492]|uniref:DUF6665 family protein n=1 Tax=Martelella sp. HB161492 TaxID=2720726 RepID=UPI001AEF1EFF|nr:DUF6665 family protein [Martelella sp. HB161492]